MAFGSKSRNNKKTELLNEQKQVLSYKPYVLPAGE